MIPPQKLAHVSLFPVSTQWDLLQTIISEPHKNGSYIQSEDMQFRQRDYLLYRALQL